MRLSSTSRVEDTSQILIFAFRILTANRLKVFWLAPRLGIRTARPEGTNTKIVFAVSTINKLVSHKISTPPVVSHKVSTPALYQIVMYLTFIVFCTRALPCPPLKMRCTHGRLPRRPSPPGQLTATEMTPRPLQNALAQWLPAPAVISARLGAGRLQLVCQD